MRRKTNKMRGRKGQGFGSRKKHRGKGSRGGKGMSGTGKRAGQKKTFILAKVGKSYYGKKGFTSLQKVKALKKRREINLDQFNTHMRSWLASGVAKRSDGVLELDLKKAGYTKLLGRGDVNEKMHIKVDAAAARAKEKVEKMGGKIILRISRSAEKTKAGGKEAKETKGREKETKVRGNK